MAVFVKQMERYFRKREKMRVQEAVSCFMRHRCSHSALGYHTAFCVQRRRNNNSLHASFAETGETQNADR